ncbi:hypothetical protein J1N35_011345 [Gossypium stocksii]|uniref:Uncharacterized protein n=1 Tax=Gossypium stocksii TaxID=47602 RepID=A0A9D4ABE2_9ROSI|nr:hypothetical protein J1N35_011345 [Gossypium stocksii]
MGRASGDELQIDEWKGNEDFEVIHVDDYDFVLGLNFFDQINVLSIPFANCICILDTCQRQCIVSVSHDEKGRTKVFSTIQLVKNVHYGKNIDLVNQSAKGPLEILEVQQTDVKPTELSVRLQPMRDVGCASNFVGKVVVQTS